MVKISEKDWKDDQWMVVADMNGHIGLNNEKLNRNGQMLLDFVESRK